MIKCIYRCLHDFIVLSKNRGFSIIGVMIAAALGLTLILGVASVVKNFSERSSKLNRQSELKIFERNITSILKSTDSWQDTKCKLNKKCCKGKRCNTTPGVNTPIVLYRAGGKKTILCRRKGGARNEGVLIFGKNGDVQNIDCKRCRTSVNCGKSESDYSRLEVTSTSTKGRRPTYVGSMIDSAILKTVRPYTSSSGEELYDELQASCEPDEFIVKVKNGEPVCLPDDFGLRGKSCGRGNVLIGFDNKGRPRCVTLVSLLRPFVDNKQRRNFVEKHRKVSEEEIDRIRRDFRTKYNTIGLSGRTTEVRGGNFSDCALLRRMTCPSGHFMSTYEALQPTAGDNCSMTCVKFLSN